jgi:polar amino acid transport system substrate-binding protein
MSYDTRRRLFCIAALLWAGGCASPRGVELPPSGQLELAAIALNSGTRLAAAGGSTPQEPARHLAPGILPDAQVRALLAPTGALRAALDLGNALLAARPRADAAPQGIAVDLAHEIGRRLQTPVVLVGYASTGALMAGLAKREWDVAFLEADPARAGRAALSTPYLVIEGAFAVPTAAAIGNSAQIDRQGARIVVGKDSIYDIALGRSLRHARLVREAATATAAATMLVRGFEAAAGPRPLLSAEAIRLGGIRVLDADFLDVEHALALPRDRQAALPWLNAFVAAIKADGSLEDALRRHGQSQNATIAR